MAYEEVLLFLAIPLLIALGFSYNRGKKVYPLMYILSIFSYINTVTYVIDSYNFGKNGILLSLILSAFLLIGIGFYMSRKKKE